MESGLEESTGESSASSSSLGAGGKDAGDFECNMCFELAQDPVVTLHGYLYCWQCPYRWLRHHSNCHECPVYKTLIQEEKVAPLYGKGKTQTNHRSKSYPGMDIARLPAGHIPDTASVPPPGVNQFPNFGFRLLEGFMPMFYAGMENFAISTVFGGLVPALFSVQFHGHQDSTIHPLCSVCNSTDIRIPPSTERLPRFVQCAIPRTSGFHHPPALFSMQFHGHQDSTIHGTTAGYTFGFNGLPNGGSTWGSHQVDTRGGHQADDVLKNLFMMVGVFVILALICW